MITVRLDPRRLRRLLIVATLTMAVLGVVARLVIDGAPGSPGAHALALFNSSAEQTVPALFSGLLLLGCAAGAALLARGAERQDPHRRRWAALAVIFGLVATDEVIAVHERFIEPLREGLGTGGPLFYAWVIPGALAVAALGLAFRGLLAALDVRVRRRALLAAALFVSGALGLEAVAGALVDEHGEGALAPHLVSVAEETLEMLGALLFLDVLLGLLGARSPRVGLELVDGPAETGSH